MTAGRDCPTCHKNVRITIAGRYWQHPNQGGDQCEFSGKPIPITELCLPTASPAPSPEGSATAEVPASPSGTVTEPQLVSPGPEKTDTYTRPSRTTPSVATATTPTPKSSNGYSQPSGYTAKQEMSELGLKMTAMFKEIFYQYTNQTGRSAQAHMGPSEIGTPCDRRLAMSLMRMPAINPGGDNWASFVGTCVHTGLASMFDWADARRGRFATEQVVTFPSELIPRGTADLIDRVLFMVDDHKVQGQWAAEKLRRVGPSMTYRIQLQVYAYGARLRGERIEHVALVSWPRDKSSLDDLYVWTAPYDAQVARDALARVDRVSAEVEHRRSATTDVQDWQVARSFPVDTSEGCGYCQFYQKDTRDAHVGGCSGR